MRGDALQRFVDAQAPMYEAVRAELAAGRKRSHWFGQAIERFQGGERDERTLASLAGEAPGGG